MRFLWWVVLCMVCTFSDLVGSIHSKKHTQIQQVARRRPMFIKIHLAGLCPGSPAENVVIENSTVDYIGTKAFINGCGYLLKEVPFIEKAVITYRACRIATEDKYCEVFQTWEWGREACDFLAHKNMIWSGLVQAIHPPIKCPVHKGFYRITNATVDSSFAQRIFGTPLLEKYFWRVQIDVFTDSLFVCFSFGVRFIPAESYY